MRARNHPIASIILVVASATIATSAASTASAATLTFLGSFAEETVSRQVSFLIREGHVDFTGISIGAHVQVEAPFFLGGGTIGHLTVQLLDVDGNLVIEKSLSGTISENIDWTQAQGIQLVATDGPSGVVFVSDSILYNIGPDFAGGSLKITLSGSIGKNPGLGVIVFTSGTRQVLVGAGHYSVLIPFMCNP